MCSWVMGRLFWLQLTGKRQHGMVKAVFSIVLKHSTRVTSRNEASQLERERSDRHETPG